MSYTKPCKKCGQRISLRKMPAGHWVAFDVSTEEAHMCGIKNEPDVSVKLKGKKKSKIEDEGEDFGIKIDDLDEDIIDKNEDDVDKDDEVEEVKTYDSVSGIHNCINEAIKKKKRIYIEYNSEHNQEYTEREISPVKKFKEKGRTYLQAYCHKRKGERIFLTKSISSASPVNKKKTKIKLGKPKVRLIREANLEEKIDEYENVSNDDYVDSNENYSYEDNTPQYDESQKEEPKRKSLFYYFIMYIAVPIWAYVLIMGLIEMSS